MKQLGSMLAVIVVFLGLDAAEVTAQCGVCFQDGSYHAFHEAAEGNEEWNEGPHSWAPGYCYYYHPPSCANGAVLREGLDATELTDLLASAVATKNAAELLRLTEESSDLVRVNAERSAIQVLGCDLRVFGHIPVDKDLVQVLLADVMIE
jgi:hypothetical protein